MAAPASSIFVALVLACIVLVAFPLGTQAACSEAAGSACTDEFESCEEPYQTNSTTNGSICDCYPPYKSCLIAAGCADSVTRELYTTQCENASCSCSWGAAGLPRGNWVLTFVSATTSWLSASPSTSLLSFLPSSFSSVLI